jgi:hypothetical protein
MRPADASQEKKKQRAERLFCLLSMNLHRRSHQAIKLSSHQAIVDELMSRLRCVALTIQPQGQNASSIALQNAMLHL